MTYNVFKDLQVGVSAEYHIHWTYAQEAEDQTYNEEFRIALQAILFQQMGRVSLQHRYRYEFKYINSTGGNRIRYRVQVTVPINKVEKIKGTFFFDFNNELFVFDVPEWSFDQNRLFLAFGYQFTKTLDFQLGYMLISKSDGNSDRLQFFLTQKLDFSKKG